MSLIQSVSTVSLDNKLSPDTQPRNKRACAFQDQKGGRKKQKIETPSTPSASSSGSAIVTIEETKAEVLEKISAWANSFFPPIKQWYELVQKAAAQKNIDRFKVRISEADDLTSLKRELETELPFLEKGIKIFVTTNTKEKLREGTALIGAGIVRIENALNAPDSKEPDPSTPKLSASKSPNTDPDH